MLVRFESHDDPKLVYIRKLARAEGYALVAGLKEFVRVRLHARLNASSDGITSISFENENDPLISYLLLMK